MTVPTETLLKQLAGEVEWLHAFGGDGTSWCNMRADSMEVQDHAEAALDIIEELEGRGRYGLFFDPTLCSFCGRQNGEGVKLIVGPRVNICSECVSAALEHLRTWPEIPKYPNPENLHRLHDLIKGCAPREAMDLIRSMMGG